MDAACFFKETASFFSPLTPMYGAKTVQRYKNILKTGEVHTDNSCFVRIFGSCFWLLAGFPR